MKSFWCRNKTAYRGLCVRTGGNVKKEKQKDREDRQICIVFATALLACALLTGCGATKEDNLSQGIALVEQMDYEGALTCFEAAALNKEDMRQVYRGRGWLTWA